MKVCVFIQARMSSERFPGKMLAPFCGRPLIASVVDGVRRGGFSSDIVVLTSTDQTDDPLADYATQHCDVSVFRGPLDDVVARFQACLVAYPCDWFVRISGDSPLMDGALVRRMTEFIDPEFDVVTNVKRRTFPPGESVECVRSAVFAKLRSSELSGPEREHVTKVFYDRSDWRVRSVVCREPHWSETRLVVDTVSDLRAVEVFAGNLAGKSLPFSSLAGIEC